MILSVMLKIYEYKVSYNERRTASFVLRVSHMIGKIEARKISSFITYNYVHITMLVSDDM